MKFLCTDCMTEFENEHCYTPACPECDLVSPVKRQIQIWVDETPHIPWWQERKVMVLVGLTLFLAALWLLRVC